MGDKDEIEVTPEMIEAGALAFVSYDSRFEDIPDAVDRIFRAMLNARPRTLEPSAP